MFPERQPSLLADVDLFGPLEEIKLSDDAPTKLDEIEVLSIDSASIEGSHDSLQVRRDEPLTEQTDYGNADTEPRAEVAESEENVTTNSIDNGSRSIESMSASEALEKLLNGEIDAQTEAQAYDAIRWIPLVGDAYSVGRAAYFAIVCGHSCFT